MATLTINVDTNWDTPPVARTANAADTINVNGAVLTVDTDTRWASNNGQTTGNFGTGSVTTISSALGGQIKLDGTKIKHLVYTGGSGSVNALSSFVALTAATWSGGTATFTVAAGAPSTGDLVDIANCYPAGWNGKQFVATNISGTQFTVPMAVDPTTIVTLGQFTKKWKVSQAIAKTNTSGTRAAAGANWLVSVLCPNHNFATGNSVVTSGMTPSAYNGTWTVTSVDNDNFTYTIIGGGDPGAITVAGTSTKTVYAEYLYPWCLAQTTGAITVGAPGGAGPYTVQFTVVTSHQFQVGDMVTIVGATPAAYNGTYQVTAIAATTFTITRADNPGTNTVVPSNVFCVERALTLPTAATAPTTTLNATGILKIKNVVNGPFEAGTLTIQGGTTPAATACGPEFTSVMEVVGADSGKMTIPRLGKFVSQGAWYTQKSAPLYSSSITVSGSAPNWVATVTTNAYSGSGVACLHNLSVGQEVTISGAVQGYFNGTWRIATVPSTSTFTFNITTAATLSNATVQGTIVPTICTTGLNTKVYGQPVSGASTFVGVWVETDVGTETYEFYPSCFTMATASAIGTDQARGKVCWMTSAGLLRFGFDGTNTQGYVPKAGLKIRFPNIQTVGITQATASTNTLIAASATRFTFTTTSAGYLSVDKTHLYWWAGAVQPFYVGMTNSTISDQISMSEIASPIAWDNLHVAPSSTTGILSLILATMFAGGTVNNSTFSTAAVATAGNISLTNMSGFSFTNCDLRSILSSNTAVGAAASNSIISLNLDSFTFTNTRIFCGRVFLQTITNTLFTNTKYCHSFSTAVNTTFSESLFDAQLSCNNVKADGLDWINAPIYSIACTSKVVTLKTSLPHGVANAAVLDIRNLPAAYVNYQAVGVTVTLVDATTLTYPIPAPDLTTQVLSSGTWNISGLNQPYNALLAVAASSNVSLRNIGGYYNRLFLGPQTGQTNNTAYIATTSTSVGSNNNIKRVYVMGTRTAPMAQLNSYSGFTMENVYSDLEDTQQVLNLNNTVKGCSWYHTPSDNTTTFASIYGSHFLDVLLPPPKQFFIPSTLAASTTVTSTGLFGEVEIGMRVRGWGIPDLAYVTAKASTSSITISAAATMTGFTRLQFAYPLLNETITHTMNCGTTSGSNIITSNQSISCTTNSTTLLTSAGLFGGVTEDMNIVGTNIPVGAKVLFKLDNSNIIMNLAATGSATNTMTFPGFQIIETTATTAASCTTTSGSNTITSTALFGSVIIGMEVSGTNIPAGSYVTSTASTSSFTINNLCTGSSSTVAVTYKTLSVGDVQIGMKVTGTGIPAGTIIIGLLDSQTAVMSDNATATNASVALSFINTTGQINILCNEPTALTASQIDTTGNSAISGFNSTGTMVLPTKGDKITWTMPYKLIGHTGFAQQPPSIIVPNATAALAVVSDATAVTVTSAAVTVTSAAAGVITITCTTASATWVGMNVWGTGISPDTTIISVTANTSFVISSQTTATTGTTLYVGGATWKSGEVLHACAGNKSIVGDSIIISAAATKGIGYNGVYVVSRPPQYTANNDVIYPQPTYPGGWAVTPTIKPAYIAISAIASAWSGGFITITTAVAHGFNPGDYITIQDAICSVNPKNFNGTWLVVATPATTQIKFAVVETTTWTSGGTIRPATNIDLFYNIDTGGGFAASWKNLRLNKKECYIDSRSIQATTATTTTVTSTAAFTSMNVGDYVLGPVAATPYISAYTWIRAIASTSSLTINQVGGAAGTNVSLYLAPTTNAVIKMGNPVYSTTNGTTTLTSTQGLSCTTASGTCVITSAALFGTVTVGMSVSGTGITAGAYVVSIESTSSLTLSMVCTSSATNTLTFVGFGNISVGMYVTGTGITAGTTVAAIASTSSLTLSAAATGTGAGRAGYCNTIDGAFVTVFAREYDNLYAYFTVDLNSGGRNPIPLNTGDDLNNHTGIRTLTASAGAGTFQVGEAIYTGASLAAATAKGVVTAVSGTGASSVVSYYVIGNLTDLSVTVTGAVSGATVTAGAFADNPAVTNPKSLTGMAINSVIGGYGLDINNGNGTKYYAVQIDPGTNKYTLSKMYEWAKYVTRRGSTDTTNNNGINGECYIGPDYKLVYTTLTGAQMASGDVVFQAATGAFGTVVTHDTTRKHIVVRNTRGSFGTGTVYDVNTPTNYTDSGTTASSISPIPVAPYGTFAGGKFFAAVGVCFNNTNLASTDIQAYQLTALDFTTQTPPNIVSVSVAGLLAGDAATIFQCRGVAGTPDKASYTMPTVASSGGTSIAVTNGTRTAIASDEPTAGYIRAVKTIGTNQTQEHRYRYASWSAQTFTLATVTSGQDAVLTAAAATNISGNLIAVTLGTAISTSEVQVGDVVYTWSTGVPGTTLSSGAIVKIVDTTHIQVRVFGTVTLGNWSGTGTKISFNKLIQTYANTDKLYVPIIDYYVSSGTSISNNLIYTSDIPVLARVRQYKSIIPFEQSSTVGATGLSVSAIRSTDTITT